MIKKFFMTQLETLKKTDWAFTVLENLRCLNINLSLNEISNLSKETFKNIVKKQMNEKVFSYLIDMKEKRNGKGKEIIYTQLKMQDYLQEEDRKITSAERKLLFQLRTRMNWNIKTNFKNFFKDLNCVACKKVLCTQKHIIVLDQIYIYHLS